LENRLYVVGVGADGAPGLSTLAGEIVRNADLLIGTERLLATVPQGRGERWAANPGKAEILTRIEAALGKRRVVVLASGDPGFFGIAKLFVRQFGKDRVEIVPALSSVQLAFARIKESWEDAVFVSVHGRSLDGITQAVRGNRKIAILTDEKNTPAAIARSLLAAGIDGYDAYLCEELGGPGERICETDLTQLVGMASSPLAVLILLWKHTEGSAPQVEPVGAPEFEGRTMPVWPHGIPDEQFHQRRPQHGLITKLEARMVALAKLGLRDSGVVWDVGAGSGSVAIEAALLVRYGQVYAIERDAESLEIILKNRERFGTQNLSIVGGEAPAALDGLPAPDAVFIGGSGGHLPAILDAVARALRPDGRLAVNAATLETAGAALAWLQDRGFDTEVTLIQASRSKDVAGSTRFEAMNPVFIIAGRRAPARNL
jgi:precorrin-6B C5,15-methyltransferase / cobalt-precorrin-6B C5,C15-methyltransferase